MFSNFRTRNLRPVKALREVQRFALARMTMKTLSLESTDLEQLDRGAAELPIRVDHDKLRKRALYTMIGYG
jgi:hypothetical protein